MKCSICKSEFQGYGHNPEPILPYEQRCCNKCNTYAVVPLRIFGLAQPAVNYLKQFGFTVKVRKDK